MALTVLTTYKNALLRGQGFDLTTANKLKVVMVTSAHTHNGATLNFLSDIAAANRVMTSNGFTGIVSGYNLDANDGVPLNDLNNGRVSSQAYLYFDTGAENTSRLIAHQSSIVITSDGTNDVLNFHTNGIFDL